MMSDDPEETVSDRMSDRMRELVATRRETARELLFGETPPTDADAPADDDDGDDAA